MPSIYRGDLIVALSAASGLVGGKDKMHPFRVAWMVEGICKILNRNEIFLFDAVAAAFLHDIGMSSSDMLESMVKQMWWPEAESHAIRGANLVRKLPGLEHLASAIEWHHTPLRKLHGMQNVDTQDVQISMLINLVDRADALHHGQGYSWPETFKILENWLKEAFIPEDLKALEQLISESGDQWDLGEFSFRFSNEYESKPMKLQDVEAYVEVFCQMVDAKSSFSAGHSKGVERVALEMAKLCKIDEDHLQELHWAALLHDIGKLHLPDDLYQRRDWIDDEDRYQFNRHSLGSFSVLRSVRGFENVSLWVLLHHERVNGVGYPFGLEDKEVPLEASILAVADVLQALTQERPYRPPMNTHKVEQTLRSMSRMGALDTKLVKLVLKDIEHWDTLARNK